MTNEKPQVRLSLFVLAVFSAMAMWWGPGAEPASACDCSDSGSDAEAVERSDVAFTGTLVERIDPEPLVTTADAVRYVFDVELVHKGSAGPLVEVESAFSTASCGAAISDEFSMFVVAIAEGDRLLTGQCGGTRPITYFEGPPQVDGQPPTPPADQGQEEVNGTDALAARTICAEASPDCIDTTDTADSTLIVSLAAGAALVVVAAAGAFWLARRRARSQ